MKRDSLAIMALLASSGWRSVVITAALLSASASCTASSAPNGASGAGAGGSGGSGGAGGAPPAVCATVADTFCRQMCACSGPGCRAQRSDGSMVELESYDACYLNFEAVFCSDAGPSRVDVEACSDSLVWFCIGNGNGNVFPIPTACEGH
jgi:hypothetical protein